MEKLLLFSCKCVKVFSCYYLLKNCCRKLFNCKSLAVSSWTNRSDELGRTLGRSHWTTAYTTRLIRLNPPNQRKKPKPYDEPYRFPIARPKKNNGTIHIIQAFFYGMKHNIIVRIPSVIRKMYQTSWFNCAFCFVFMLHFMHGSPSNFWIQFGSVARLTVMPRV